MGSTPKDTTTKVEPWDGAKDYLTDIYSQYDKLISNGAPKPYDGKTIADQSKATTDALKQAENLARNGNTSVLDNANKSVNSVLNQSGNTQANKTLSSLQSNTSLGTNPIDNIAKMIAGGNTAQAPGQFNTGYTDPATAQAANSGQYTNGAVGQAANLNGYTNAAAGLQTNQANSLASSNNPAMQYLQQTASGAQIGKNPYLEQSISNAQDSIAQKLQNVTNPAISSQAASMGRMGSGAFASQINNAQTAAANEMAKVSTDAYQQQYNADVASQQNAANMYGNFANQDTANRLNANQALSNTSNAQQGQRIAGTQLYGNLNDAQQSQRLNGTQLYGNLNDAQQTQRYNASNAANQQFNADRNFQLEGLNLQNNSYQQNIQNMLGLNSQRMNAANSQLDAQSNLNGQKLTAAGMSGDIYGQSYLPSNYLSNIGAQRDDRAGLELQATVNQWDRAQQQPLANLGNFASLLNGGGYSNTTTPVYSNSGAQALGGIGSLLGTLLGLCDIREKHIKRFVGFMPLTNGDTIGMFEFTYKDDVEQEIWVGPIAQSVEEAIPGSTVEIDGKLHIDVATFMSEAA